MSTKVPFELPRSSIHQLSSRYYLRKLKIQKSALPILSDDRGLFDTGVGGHGHHGGTSPIWVANFDLSWRKGKWDANYGVNYQSKLLRRPLLNVQRDQAAEIIDDPFVDSFINHELQVAYSPNDRVRVHGGVWNLTDESPDEVQGSLNGPSGRQGFAGRSYYLGITVQLGGT